MHRHITLIGMIIMVAASVVTQVRAEIVKWQGTTGNWSTGSNWDNGEPDDTDEVYIRNNGTAQIAAPNDEVCYDLTVGYWVGDEGTLEMSGGTLTVEHYLTLARYSTGFGTVEMSGGTLSAVREYIGDGAGTKGGVFNQSGGTNTVSDYLNIGDDPSSTGAYDLSGTGVLNLTGTSGEFGMTVGSNGTGTFDQTGGTINGDRKVKIGRFGTGTYTVSDGTMDVYRVEVSDNLSGSGTFKVTGDDATINLEWYLARGGNGTLVSEIDADGISTINVTSKAIVSGTWTVIDSGAAPGSTYDILVADLGFDGSTFDTVNLPNMIDWSWGIDGSGENPTTLWVERAPVRGTLVVVN